MEIKWENGFDVRVSNENQEVVIAANAAGLQSLANICRALAQEPAGTHIHLDEYNSLEDGSTELILMKNE